MSRIFFDTPTFLVWNVLKTGFFSGRCKAGHKNDEKISSLLIFAMFFIISKRIPSNDNQVVCIIFFDSALTEKLRTLFSWKICYCDLTEKRTQFDEFFSSFFLSNSSTLTYPHISWPESDTHLESFNVQGRREMIMLIEITETRSGNWRIVKLKMVLYG